ncbi:hypothetical protein BH18ACI4_BH18ACI4_00800 [soil metagenome]
MPIESYRPWGLLSWVLDKCPQLDWYLLASLSPEERCLAVWQLLNSRGRLAGTYLAQISDPPAPRYDLLRAAKISDRRMEFDSSGGAASTLHSHALFEKTGDLIAWIEGFISAAGPNIILDISTLPKRFFFPVVKKVLKTNSVQNLIVTYTAPRAYPNDLAENFEAWRPLPLFGGKLEQPTRLIINVGYLAMGLPEELEQGGPDRLVKLIFPFPDSPTSYSRNTFFVRTIEKNLRRERVELRHVGVNDASDAFDHLIAWTDGGKEPALLAPYGPKPISLAMCIFATLTDSAVYYTQPRTYNPDYSLGISRRDGISEVYAYCLRLSGSDYYALPSP